MERCQNFSPRTQKVGGLHCDDGVCSLPVFKNKNLWTESARMPEKATTVHLSEYHEVNINCKHRVLTIKG